MDNSYSNIYFREVVEYGNMVGQTLALDPEDAGSNDRPAGQNNNHCLEALTLQLQ
jgi:hypothetical protein